MIKTITCTPNKTKIPTENISKYFSSKKGLKRTARANSIEIQITNVSKKRKKTLLTLRGKSDKYFNKK